MAKSSKLRLVALGGLHELGKNMWVYEAPSSEDTKNTNEYLVVDAGISYPGREAPGIDYVLPEYQYIKENEDRIQALVPQDSLSAFNPVYKVGAQLIEAIDVYQPDLSAEEKQAKVLELFAKVGIPEPERSFNAYPHEISGGMRQRALIAMALINEPDLIIADEPTTALDVTVQSMVLDLLKSLNKTILFITHDLGVVAEIADRVVVMRHGKIVESNDVFDLFENPREDYTKDLLAHCL